MLCVCVFTTIKQNYCFAKNNNKKKISHVRIKIHQSWDMMYLKCGTHMDAHTFVRNYFNGFGMRK